MPKRIRMSLRLQEKDFDFPFEVTPVKENLITEIAEAMHDAYEGTIDYEGENLCQTQNFHQPSLILALTQFRLLSHGLD